MGGGSTEAGAPTLLGETLATGEARGPERGGALERLGRYEITGKLGAGAFGTVYAARDPTLDREVAIKTLHPELSRGVNLKRFRAEAVALAQLSHTNVVPVYDVGREDRITYIVMQMLEAETLRQWMERPHAPAEVMAMFVAAGRGLVAAHELGLVHRDFKPENVLIDAEGTPRVADFGLAQIDRSEATAFGPGEIPDAGAIVDRLTRTGRMMGTPAYMAPEQFAGGSLDARVDQFAFCVALFEALTGARPFPGATVEALVASVYGTDRDTLGDDLPRGVREPLRRGLALEPTDRYPTTEALLRALERRGTPSRVWLVVPAMAAVLLGVWAFASGDKTAPPIDEAPVVGEAPTLSAEQQAAIDRARTLLGDGDYPAALEAADHALELVSGIPEAEAEAEVVRSRLLAGLYRPIGSREAAERAYALASEAGATSTAARAALQVVLTGTPEQRARDGEHWFGVASAEVSRAELGPLQQARLALAAGRLAYDGGDSLAALEHLKKAHEVVPARHVTVRATILRFRSRSLRQKGRAADAIPVARQGVDLCRAELGESHPATLVTTLEHAEALAAAGRADEAIGVVRDALAIEEGAGANPHWRLRASMALIGSLRNAGRYDEALSAIAEARRLAAATPSEWSTVDQDLLRHELTSLLLLNRTRDAHRIASALVDALIADHGEHHAITLQARVGLATVEVALGRLDVGEARFREIGKDPAATDSHRREAERGLALVAMQRGHYDEAARRFATAVDQFAAAGHAGYAGDTRVHLARALLARGDREEGVAQLRRAKAELEEAGGAWWREVEHLESVAAEFDVEL